MIKTKESAHATSFNRAIPILFPMWTAEIRDGAGKIPGIFSSVGLASRLGATPGKLVLKLKVVRPDGAKVSLGRALGRYFAKMISAVLLGIGYIMAAFDPEKRALHDRIADTRVIKARS